MENRTTTKDQLASALIELLKEQSFINITVSSLVRKAGVSRASFYRNFGTTSDVMDYILDNFISRLLSIALPVIDSTDERKWREFLFQLIYFLRSSENNYIQMRSDNMALLFNNFISKAREVRQSFSPRSKEETRILTAKLALISGVLTDWKENGMQESTEEIVDFIMSCIRKL